MEMLTELGVAIGERVLHVGLQLAVHLLVLLNRFVVLLRGLRVLILALYTDYEKELKGRQRPKEIPSRRCPCRAGDRRGE